MRKTILLIIGIGTFNIIFSQEIDSTQLIIDEIENSLEYEIGTIELEHGNAKINIPDGFKFLNQKQSLYVLMDLWGNPEDETVMGMLVPESQGVLDDNGWVFTVSYEAMGYVDDEDANDYNYDELEQELIDETEENNSGRIKQGYEAMHFIGWASTPHYDKEKKILHWAKEYKFGNDSINTLNYNLRILGRKGVFMFNAISLMPELDKVDANIDVVLNSVEFNKGFGYFDFDPEIDEVASWTIGGLVAGKILAKVGFFALAFKFWKIIAVGFVSLFGFLWKKRKNNNSDSEKTNQQLE